MEIPIITESARLASIRHFLNNLNHAAPYHHDARPGNARLRTLPEAAAELRVTPRKLRELVNDRRIGFVLIGKKKAMIPDEAIERFIAEETVQTCHAQTQARSFAPMPNAAATSISSGQNEAAAASAARALAITAKPSKSSANSSLHGTDGQGLVIPLKRS